MIKNNNLKCEPAKGGVSEGGGPGISPPGTATVSKHETGTPPGTAAVSKHETGTVAKQTAGALQFMVDFALRGGGCNTSGNMSHFIVPWEAGGPSPLKPARVWHKS